MGELEGYIREDVERYGTKLQDIHRKLEGSYAETIHASLNDGQAMDPDFEYQENDEAFTSGHLIGGDDLGDDFFGFRELGIDREVGLGSLTIPSRVWYGRRPEGDPFKPKGLPGVPGSGDSSKADLPYPPPPTFIPLSDPTATVGLLHAFFKKRLEDLGSLKEDEFMPVSKRVSSRPKIPPTGKIVSSMKKRSNKLGESNALAEARKLKRKKEKDALDAERAERKRQKQDAKDKKLMEKMERKKIKEESKGKTSKPKKVGDI